MAINCLDFREYKVLEHFKMDLISSQPASLPTPEWVDVERCGLSGTETPNSSSILPIVIHLF